MEVFPQWIPFTEENRPCHGEYLVLLKQDSAYQYLTVAAYTYHDGGQWMSDEKVITQQVEAYLGPRVLPKYMIDADKPTNEAQIRSQNEQR